MEKKVQQYKIDAAADLSAMIESCDDIFFAEYRGLAAAQMADLRRELAKHNAKCRVAKNSFLRVAFRALGKESQVEQFLTGPTAAVFINGESGPAAKALVTFAKDAPSLVLKGGLVVGEVYDAKQLVAYSALPTKIDLVAMFARVLNEPMAQLARVLQAVADNKNTAA